MRKSNRDNHESSDRAWAAPLQSASGVAVQFWKAALAGVSGSRHQGIRRPADDVSVTVAGQIQTTQRGSNISKDRTSSAKLRPSSPWSRTKEAGADSGLRLDRGIRTESTPWWAPHGRDAHCRAGVPSRLSKSEAETGSILTLSHGHAQLRLRRPRHHVWAKGPNVTISTPARPAPMPSAWPWGHSHRTATSSLFAGAERDIVPLTLRLCTLRRLSTSSTAPRESLAPVQPNARRVRHGRGAGALILESLLHPKKRKARIYAEVAGYARYQRGLSQMVIPRRRVEISITMAMALRNAGVRPRRWTTSTPTRRPQPSGTR